VGGGWVRENKQLLLTRLLFLNNNKRWKVNKGAEKV